MEYEAILAGLRLSEDIKAKELEIFTDLKLVASQVSGEYQVNNENLVEYLTLVRKRIAQFKTAVIRHIPQEHNT